MGQNLVMRLHRLALIEMAAYSSLLSGAHDVVLYECVCLIKRGNQFQLNSGSFVFTLSLLCCHVTSKTTISEQLSHWWGNARELAELQ